MQLPYPPLKWALILLRVTTALLFMAHATARIAYGTIPQFAKFMSSQGFPYPGYWVWAITLAELVSGTAMIIGWRVRCATVPLLAIAIGGIVLIHWRFGWFVGEHGTGGSEYSIALIVMLLVVAAGDTYDAALPTNEEYVPKA
ncbi:MAG: DoxX family protein [Sphingomonadales bacterium]|nr:DoxX family protein [Sphingomonadales bacterium]